MAGFTVENFSDYYGQENTMYGAWESFTNANNAPNFADNGGNMGFAGQVFNFSGSGFITGGNLYDAQQALNIHNYFTLDGVDITNAQVNVSTMGTVVDFSGVLFQAVTSTGASQFLDTSDVSDQLQSGNPWHGGFHEHELVIRSQWHRG